MAVNTTEPLSHRTRMVYLTSESGGCFVHMQISNVDQARRHCPPFVADAAP
jgi:hypothetical protein